MAVTFLAGAAAMHLLDDNKQPNVIHNHHYVPLSAEQSDLYMKSNEYLTHLSQSCEAKFLYFDKNDCLKPRTLINRNTGERRVITKQQAFVLIENEKKLRRKQEKDILMTKGIGEVNSKVIYSGEKPLSEKICCYICWLPCLPCWIKDELNKKDPEDTEGKLLVVQVGRSHFDLLKV